MKKIFIASLCRNGILGGCIIADDESVTYKTGKVSVSPNLKNIEMKYGDIKGVSKDWLLCFPTVSAIMNNGETYRFIVFRRKQFCDLLESRIIL